jgi:ABC-type glycerol-3-phosphate transport system permease component
MPIMLKTERRSPRARLIIAAIYALLCLGGATMIYPFMITVSASFSNKFDYHRFRPVPRSLFSRADRFTRGLAGYFPTTIPPALFPERPQYWTTLQAAGDDLPGIDAFAAPYLAVERDPERLDAWRRIAADYADFSLDYDIRDTFCRYDFRDLARYLCDVYDSRVDEDVSHGGRRREAALALLNEEWGVPYEEFFDITLDFELHYPMHHVSWDYPETPKAAAFLAFKDAYRRMVFRPGAEEQWRASLREDGRDGPAPWPVPRCSTVLWPVFKRFVGRQCPAAATRPFLMKEQWLKFFDRQSTRDALGLSGGERFTVGQYNRLFGAEFRSLQAVPFPIPDSAGGRLREMWDIFVRDYYPLRLKRVKQTPVTAAAYRDLLRGRFKTVENYNSVMAGQDDAFRGVAGFDEVLPPAYENSIPWRAFVRSLPPEAVELHSSERAWQDYLLGRYGSPEGVNRAYGWELRTIEEARIPFAEAYTITFLNNEWRYYLNDIAKNFRQVLDFMFIRGRAFLNTAILVILTVMATLTVNPMAAYALSRFRLKFKEQILLFLLATMAFPAAVRAIPGFLLMRDLGLLNSFAALVLPGLANGMSIFILKCFFDGLPRELYEAAAIDGAPEWQVFLKITLPLTKPILAINTLYAFIAAYNSWQWALLVCQDKDYWTLAVWLFEMQSAWAAHPHVIMAAFTIASIPTAIVFITCQKVILRGIVIPSMK